MLISRPWTRSHSNRLYHQLVGTDYGYALVNDLEVTISVKRKIKHQLAWRRIIVQFSKLMKSCISLTGPCPRQIPFGRLWIFPEAK